MRLFGGERIEKMVTTLKIPEDEPIEQGLLTSVIENSQKKVEGKNYGIRKYVLQYDDVMNQHAERRRVLDGEDLRESIHGMIDEVLDDAMRRYAVAEYPDDWNMTGLEEYLESMFFTRGELDFHSRDYNTLDRDTVREELEEKVEAAYAAQEELFGENMREVERVIMLRAVDSRWMDHIDDMEQLKNGINLRAYGQHDPVIEYKMTGSDMFDEMIAAIREDTVRYLFHVKPQAQIERKMVATPTVASHGDDSEAKRPERRREQKIGRNDPCPCGSGKKYKNCCMLKEENKQQ